MGAELGAQVVKQTWYWVRKLHFLCSTGGQVIVTAERPPTLEHGHKLAGHPAHVPPAAVDAEHGGGRDADAAGGYAGDAQVHHVDVLRRPMGALGCVGNKKECVAVQWPELGVWGFRFCGAVRKSPNFRAIRSL